METLTPWPVTVSDGSAGPAFLAGKKDKVKLCGVALLTWMLEKPPRLKLICAGPTCERSKKPLEETVSVDKVPALTVFGETLMGACACAAEINRERTAIATRPTTHRSFAYGVVVDFCAWADGLETKQPVTNGARIGRPTSFLVIAPSYVLTMISSDIASQSMKAYAVHR
jgi:hypothetical protein